MKVITQSDNLPEAKTPPTTANKTNNYLSSPQFAFSSGSPAPDYLPSDLIKKFNYRQDSGLQMKNIIKQSHRRIGSNISMVDLIKENIDNRDIKENAYLKIMNSTQRSEEIQLLHNEHRIEIEKLLLQISRLHDVIYEVERAKKYEAQKLKEQYQHITYLHLSNLKQSQITQLEILETQLKKTKEALETKIEENMELQKAKAKDRQMFRNEIETLRNNLKETIHKKNEQIFFIQENNQEKMKEIRKKNQYELDSLKDSCNREINRIQRELKNKEEQAEKYRLENFEVSEKNNVLEQTIQKQRIQIQMRLQDYINQNSDKYEDLSRHINEIINEQEKAQDAKQSILKEVYQNQIKNLLNIIKLKDTENNRLKAQLETYKLENKLLIENSQEEIGQLRNLLKRVRLENLQEIEKLKVKMALLHENDINELVKLYEAKIQSLNQELSRENTQTNRLRSFMHQQTHRWYEKKKNYEREASQLNVEILRLKNGLGILEKDMKQKIQNERSQMILTSKSLIRDKELKNTNAQFFEQQAKKLRKTIQKMEKNSEQTERQLKQQIKNLQNEIKRISEAKRQMDGEVEKTEAIYRQKLEQKENQIKRLNIVTFQILDQAGLKEKDKIQELLKNIKKLNQSLQEKNDKIRQLSLKIEKLQKEILDYKALNEHLYLENQINHQQAKEEYEKIAKSNLKSLEEFYQKKIRELESDKDELKSKQSEDQINIAELVRRYTILEGHVRKMSRQAKRRTELQEKIMSLGMDNNLVKNKVELFGDIFEKKQE